MGVYDISGNALVVSDGEKNFLPLGEGIAKSNSLFLNEEFMKIVLLDNNYKYFSVANIETIIDQMHTSGLNYLMLGFGGSGRGLGFKLNDMRITANGQSYDLSNCVLTDFGKYLSESDMDNIITYARNKGIDIIPLFTLPGHFRPFLVHQPQFRYNNDPDSLDINNPYAWEYGLSVAELYIKWFATRGIKYWNFGADEFGDINSGYYNLYTSGNYKYADFINELAYIVTTYRMIPMSWNDPICVNNDSTPFINRNIPVFYWKYYTHWASATVIENDGHKMINSSRSIYWVANGQQVTETQMRQFNIHSFEGQSTISNPVGACFCIWIGTRESPALDDDGAAITQAILPLIAAFGETIASQVN